MTLPDADTSFFYAALHQLDPAVRPTFTARVAAIIGANPDPGPGDVDRAIRAALTGLWTPPPDRLGQLEGRWARRSGYITKRGSNRSAARTGVPGERHATLVKQDIEALG